MNTSLYHATIDLSPPFDSNYRLPEPVIQFPPDQIPLGPLPNPNLDYHHACAPSHIHAPPTSYTHGKPFQQIKYP
ncbi:hypothetical protein K491DRAFT_688391 [Lophiostoma macrostomum CBS 122681]|uniref:Uncharacterized protein n=1 Tax=Lophiostoma macrostomum CBS 122681 TaxID=1314788 RepID=A0A6A6TKS3_9PLEO|nr:hypothetical protein K491DRAFT_688391 [Lophiostoma macrostomum CBS 122681]